MEFSEREISEFRNDCGGENDCKKTILFVLISEEYNAFWVGLERNNLLAFKINFTQNLIPNVHFKKNENMFGRMTDI